MATDRATSFSELAAHAAKQHGLMTHKQAIDAGLSRTAISRLVQSGVWQLVRPRVFRKAAGTQTEEQALRALCLWLGKRVVVSHRSAARLLGLNMVRGDLEVTTHPGQRGDALDGVVIHRSKSLPEKDIKEVRGIRVTNGARTIIDLASVLTEDELAIVVEEAWRRKIATPAWVSERHAKLPARARRTGALPDILSDCRRRDDPLESALAVRVWRLLKSANLPRMCPEYEFRDDFGQPWHVDFAFPDHHLAIECDGYETHGDRESFENDRFRAARLVALGWRVMALTWRQVEQQPTKVIERIRQALRFRSQTFG